MVFAQVGVSRRGVTQ
uniref:Uncharacterized protein n=1 Tax=Arundo donax TaxID=35708 RepID=A0A0A8YY14_ARUDO